MWDASFKYKFDDKGFRAITSAVSKLNASRLRVGVVGGAGEALHTGDAHTGARLKVWQIAALQEFGSRDNHIPERSFIRRTLNDLIWLRAIMSRAAQRVVSGKNTANGALEWLGGVVVRAIQHTIMQSVPPPNASETVQWKGHSHTLIGQTGALFDAVSFDITTGATGTPTIPVGLDD